MNLFRARWIPLLVIALSLVLFPTLPQLAARATAQSEAIDPADAEKMDAIEAAVTELRGLQPASPIARAVMTRAELEAWLAEQLASEYTPEEARDDAIFYNALDFMPLDTDLWQLQLDLLTEQIAGFYDAEGGRMVVVGDSFDSVAELTYAHEFTHALQDQSFNLASLEIGLVGDEQPDTPDLILARLALIEGDASQVMADYLMYRVQEQRDAAFALGLFGGLVGVSMAQLDSAPAIINAELFFPYLDGQAFIQAALERGGWALVDAIYERPPLSTEHILHPEQYFNADEPDLVQLVPADATLGASWRLVHNFTLGEFYLREYLAQRVPDSDATRAAEGWGGDSLAVYFNDATEGIVWVLRADWDSASHGQEFEAVYTAFASTRYGAEPIMTMEDGAVCWDGAVSAPGASDAEPAQPMRYDSTCLLHSGSDTLIVQGPDLNTVLAVQQTQLRLD
ncbi:MAG: hypothetical protein Kow00120_09550 [Anaerolineae bacterium]